MTAIQYLMSELKLEPEEAISLHALLQNWKHNYRAGAAKALDRKAWRKRRDIITDPNNISDRLLGYEMGVADGYDEAIKFIDSMVENLGRATKGTTP